MSFERLRYELKAPRKHPYFQGLPRMDAGRPRWNGQALVEVLRQASVATAG
jgi:hypothetical protein